MALVMLNTIPLATAAQFTDTEIATSAAARNTTAMRPAMGVRGVEGLIESSYYAGNDYNTTTYGNVSFRRVEFEEEREVLVADSRLQERLESLCDTLRARY